MSHGTAGSSGTSSGSFATFSAKYVRNAGAALATAFKPPSRSCRRFSEDVSSNATANVKELVSARCEANAASNITKDLAKASKFLRKRLAFHSEKPHPNPAPRSDPIRRDVPADASVWQVVAAEYDDMLQDMQRHMQERRAEVDLEDESNESTVASGEESIACGSFSETGSESEGEQKEDLPALEDRDLRMRWEVALHGRTIDQVGREELQELVLLGMSRKHRQQLWSHCSSAMHIRSIDELQTNVSDAAAHQIDLDIPRTRPRLNSFGQASVRRVLRAYAVHNADVGYCQGMSHMVAVFIALGFEEPVALRGFFYIAERCCPDYFGPSLKGYVRDIEVLEILVRRVLPPEICRKLDSMNMPLHTFAAEHFLSLGSHNWPLGAVTRFWDLLFMEGSAAVFASFLALLQLYLPPEEPTSHGDASDEVKAFMKSVKHGVANDLDKILEKTRELLPQVPDSLLVTLRYFCSGTIFEDFEDLNTIRAISRPRSSSIG